MAQHIYGHAIPLHDPMPDEVGTFETTAYALSPAAYEFAMNLLADLADGKIELERLSREAQMFFERFDIPKPE